MAKKQSPKKPPVKPKKKSVTGKAEPEKVKIGPLDPPPPKGGGGAIIPDDSQQ